MKSLHDFSVVIVLDRELVRAGGDPRQTTKSTCIEKITRVKGDGKVYVPAKGASCYAGENEPSHDLKIWEESV